MLVQLYVAPQIGTGTRADPYRSVIQNYIDISAGESFDEIDFPSRRKSICAVFALQATHDVINADNTIIPLLPSIQPDEAAWHAILDTPLTEFPSAWKTAASTKLEAAGIPVDWIISTTTLRDLLRYILRVFAWCQIVTGQGNVNVMAFLSNNIDATVGSLSTAQRNAVRTWMQGVGLDTLWILGTTLVRQVVTFIVNNYGFKPFAFAGETF
jgi:hypothetical protein